MKKTVHASLATMVPIPFDYLQACDSTSVAPLVPLGVLGRCSVETYFQCMMIARVSH